MKVRGRRRCAECGERWSYYETGSPACPSCGSLRSVGVEADRTLHTDAPAEFDLSAARSMLDGRPLDEVAEAAARAARAYLRARGFVRGGELLALDDEMLAAAELRHVAGRLERALDVTEAEERHFLDLLAGAEAGTRPGDVPASLRAARGLAAVDAVEAYRRDLSAWLDEATGSGDDGPDATGALDREGREAVRPVLARLRDQERRVSALDGDVPPAEADALVAAARGIGEFLSEVDDDALATARERLDRLG